MTHRASPFISNLLWFGASIALAFFVWLIATNETDPVRERLYNGIPITIEVSDNLLITNLDSLRRTVNVTVRARLSVLEVLTREDITVTMDLQTLPPGTHTVRLQTDIARPAISDTSPLQLTVDLAERVARQKPIVVRIAQAPPAGFQAAEPIVSETQALVSGAAEQVERVDRLEAALDLSDRRDTFDEVVALVPVDADGTPITDVTVTQEVRVFVEISAVDGVAEFPVRPVINFESLPEGYVARLIDYNPKIVTVSGSPDSLARLADSLDTETIDLTNRTESFSVNTLIPLPIADLAVVDNQQVSVQIDIQPRITQRQFDDVMVMFDGLAAGLQARAIPSRVSVLVNGPQPLLETLTAQNITVLVNAASLDVGTYDRDPTATINVGDIPPDDIRVLPSTIGLIISPQVTPTPTAQP